MGLTAMNQWLLIDNSEPVDFDENHNPLQPPTVEINDELKLQEQFSILMRKQPHVVVLRSERGESITVGVGAEFGWLVYRPNRSVRSYTFIPRTPVAGYLLEFQSEAGMTEVLPEHLLPMKTVIRLLYLICFHNVVPCLTSDLR
jgi:hypothetical protein